MAGLTVAMKAINLEIRRRRAQIVNTLMKTTIDPSLRINVRSLSVGGIELSGFFCVIHCCPAPFELYFVPCIRLFAIILVRYQSNIHVDARPIIG